MLVLAEIYSNEQIWIFIKFIDNFHIKKALKKSLLKIIIAKIFFSTLFDHSKCDKDVRVDLQFFLRLENIWAFELAKMKEEPRIIRESSHYFETNSGEFSYSYIVLFCFAVYLVVILDNFKIEVWTQSRQLWLKSKHEKTMSHREFEILSVGQCRSWAAYHWVLMNYACLRN